MAMNPNPEAAKGVIGMSGAIGRPRAALLLIGLALLAVAMLRNSLAFIVRPIDPALALRIDPTNAEVAASRSEQLLRTDPSPANRTLSEQLARRALDRSPTSAAAARMLATTRDLAGDPSSARRLMRYSESLSRRDLPTQLWFIEDAVRRNDVPQALHHYDIALRGSVTTAPLLFPVLVAALAQPPVVEGLIDTLRAKPRWADAFLNQASHDARDFDGLARLLVGLARHGYPLPDTTIALATARMADAGRYDRAWETYSASRHGAVRSGLRDPDFARLGENATPFDWAILPGSGIAAEPRLEGPASRLAYHAATGAGGVVARQLLLLPRASYIVGGRAFNAASAAQLRLTCAGGGAVIATIPIENGGEHGAAFASRVTVPAGCTAQWLEVVVDGGDDPAGSSGEISQLRVLPVPEGRR
ncbi:hypothetical protein [Sphingomonas crusticola]|uniref:hypothetical protein n=1 Tax=Sphingomonas crusticola TaxID=1697973 RepID=UPI000E281AC3|nr:hypothetical protein [Sphingomonas crusticola]